MGAVIRGRAVLVIRSVVRNVLVPMLSVPLRSVYGGDRHALVVDGAVAELPDHPLSLRKGDHHEHE